MHVMLHVILITLPKFARVMFSCKLHERTMSDKIIKNTTVIEGLETAGHSLDGDSKEEGVSQCIATY